jgi:hypothetical protein
LTEKKNGKRGNKLRKELKIKLSHYYFSLQCDMHEIYTKKALFVYNLLLIGSSEREEDLLG